MHSYSRVLKILLVIMILPTVFLGCGGDRVNVEFKTSRQFYVDDSKTDPDKLDRELEYDIREAEKKRRLKQREAEAAAKSRSEQKVKESQPIQEQTSEEETTPSEEAEQAAE